MSTPSATIHNPLLRHSSTPVFALGTPWPAWETLARAALVSSPDVAEWVANGLPAWLDVTIGKDASAWADRSADAALMEAAAARSPRGGLDARTCWLLGALDQRYPRSRFVVFVDPPHRALAHWLSSHGSGSVEQAVELWTDGARRSLHHAHRYPQRVLLIDTAEAAAAPKALDGLLAPWGLVLGDWQPPPSRHNVALEAIASLLVADRPAVQALWEELHGSCTPLGDAAAQVPAAPQPRIWKEELAAHYRDTNRSLDEARRALAQATQDHADELRALQVGLLQQLNAAQQTIEGHLSGEREQTKRLQALGERELQLQKSLSESAAEMGLVRKERDKLLTDIATVRKERDGLRTERDSLKAEKVVLAAAAAQLTNVRSELKRARQEATQVQALQARIDTDGRATELLQQQAQQLQNQLKRKDVALRQLKRLMTIDGSVIAFDRLTFAAAVSHPPHDHIDITLDGVRLPGRTLTRVRARLLEHAGRCGLALLSEPSVPAPLRRWEPERQEGPHGVLTLIPDDANGRARLQHMGGSDWLSVVGLARTIAGALNNESFIDAVRWRSVAARLVVQLAALPPRLRYDHIDMLAVDDGPKNAVDLQLHHAVHGERRLGSPVLRLDRSAPGEPQLGWVSAADAVPPLPSWPMDAQGAAAGHWLLPVGAAGSAADKRRVWAGLSPWERDLLLGMLDALCNAEALAAPQPMPAGLTAEGMAAQARTLRIEAARLLMSLRLRHAARRALGRG